MTLHRCIHPSGHGAFFTEIIHEEGAQDIIVVYDCGCKEDSEKTLLKREVNEFFRNRKTIDILFISHFDSDHVNGIKLLMPYIDKSTKVFMPFSYEFLYIAIDSAIIKQIGDTLNTLEQKSNIKNHYWVIYYQGGDDQGRVTDYREIEGPMIQSGKRIGLHYDFSVLGNYKWLYVPFNLFDDKVYRDKFNKEVAAGWGVKPQDIEPSALDEIAITKLRRIYKSIGPHNTNTPNDQTNKSNGSKNINENSLLVLSMSAAYDCKTLTKSFPLVEELAERFRFYRYRRFALGNGSCLFTGDSNLGTKERVMTLRRIIDGYVDMPIELFQLPHHGSRQYYCRELLSDYDLFIHLFVNCGAYDFRQKSFPRLLKDIDESFRRINIVSGKRVCRLEQSVNIGNVPE